MLREGNTSSEPLRNIVADPSESKLGKENHDRSNWRKIASFLNISITFFPPDFSNSY